MIQQLEKYATATAAVGGTATFTFESVPMGLVWTGTLGVFNAPVAAGFFARVGVPGAGNPWGSWTGNGTFGPIQATGRFTVQVVATGLTAGTQYTCAWLGNSGFDWEVDPVSPSALTTAVIASTSGYTSPWTDSTTLAYVVDNLAAGSTSTGDFRTITVNGVSMDIEFFDYASDQTFSVTANLGTAGNDDTKYVVARFQGALNISNGVTISVPGRRRGLILLSRGIATIAGTVTMTNRGASAAGQAIQLVTAYNVPAAGAAGGAAQTDAGVGVNGLAGTAGVNGQTGGGGGGGALRGTSGTGSTGTSGSGGIGGGGVRESGGSATAGNGAANGGAGGVAADGGAAVTAGGGAGNPGGLGKGGGANGTTGSAGLLVLFNSVDATLSATGVLSSNGADGGALYGGNTGGGSVNVVTHGTLTNSGTIQATGGTAGAGGSGGVGTARAVTA